MSDLARRILFHLGDGRTPAEVAIANVLAECERLRSIGRNSGSVRDEVQADRFEQTIARDLRLTD